MTEICPGCRAELEAVDGPAHRYIGASPACWDIYARLLAGEPPMGGASLYPLLVDAYAAQHPGDDSPQATQSVAVHLVVLEAVLGHGMSLDKAVPIRIATVEMGRRGHHYPKLEPVPHSWDLTLADIVNEETEAERAAAGDRYVRSVWQTWKGSHGPLIEDWHRTASRQLDR
jgi:hypothetical protein